MSLPQKTMEKRLLISFVTKASLDSLAPGKKSFKKGERKKARREIRETFDNVEMLKYSFTLFPPQW